MRSETSVARIIGGAIRAGKCLSFLLLAAIAGSILFALLPPLVLERIVDALADREQVTVSLAVGYFLLLQPLAAYIRNILILCASGSYHLLGREPI